MGVEGSSDPAAARTVARFWVPSTTSIVTPSKRWRPSCPRSSLSGIIRPGLVRSAIPNYFLARLAADHVKVLLTGEGADELYAGYTYLGARTDPEALHEELIYITGALHNTNLQRADLMAMAHG
ncbi:MAG: asparagine synthase-related protein [Caldilineaceae bacterium]